MMKRRKIYDNYGIDGLKRMEMGQILEVVQEIHRHV